MFTGIFIFIKVFGAIASRKINDDILDLLINENYVIIIQNENESKFIRDHIIRSSLISFIQKLELVKRIKFFHLSLGTYYLTILLSLH